MRMLIALLALVGAAVAGVAAHHSYGATYDVKREIRLEGRLVQFVYRNPHSFVHVQAPDQSGAMQRWAVEWSGTSQLANSGITRESLKVGDEVVMVVRPSRVPNEFKGLMVTLRRPSDGFTWGVRGGEVVD